MEAEKFNYLLRLMDIGDESALDIIQKEYGKRIKWVAFSILNDWHYAKDILNAVMQKLWNKSRKFQNIVNPDACIYDLAKKTSIDFYRSKLKKHKKEIKLDDVSLNEASQHLVHNDDYSELNFLSMINSLNEVEKEIIIKKVAFKFTHAEIAEDMQIPEGTVKWKYQVTLEKLKKKIEEENNSS